ncbi:hypothetical protein [Nitrosopumilus sp.]|nr:hypothetical protein [Nitrosopumilus sp.]
MLFPLRKHWVTFGHEQNLDDKNAELALIYDGVDVDYAGECKDLPIRAGQ